MWIIAVHSCIITGIIFLWCYQLRGTRLASWFLPAISIKIIGGWLVGCLYLYYYSGGDTWNYFTDGLALAKFARTNWMNYILSWINTDYLPGGLIYTNQPRALFMSRIVSIGCLFTQDNYWLISTYFSVLSFGGIWYLVQTLIRFFPRTQYAVGIAWLTYPSFVFWSSGILKEAIAVGLISTLVAQTIRFYYADKKGQTSLLVMGWLAAAMLLWLVKYYYAAVLVPLLLAIMLAQFIPVGRLSVTAKAVSLFFILISLATFLHPNLEVDRILGVIVQNHDTFVQISHTDVIIHFYQLKPTLASFLLNAPLAIFSAWYRPLPFDLNTILAQVAGLENCLLLVVSMLALRKVKLARVVENDVHLWVVAIFLFAILLGGLLAISTPNFGTLIRYKVAFSPLLLYLLLCPLLRRNS